MCFRLFLASPLTLSEIRSMLPEGITADLVPPAQQRAFLDHLPRARLVVGLRHGGCACDLIGRTARREEDERELRTRYRRSGTDRSEVIRALEAHRRQGPMLRLGVNVAEAFSAFVAEHARNAGPSVYLLDFSPDPDHLPAWPGGTTQTTAAAVRRAPGTWLDEGVPVVVAP